jgi:hypothetical protein
VTTSLIKNIRSTTNFNFYKIKIAKTESHNQSFVLKYIRILRDKKSKKRRTALNASPHTKQQKTTLTKSSANNAVYQLKTRPAYPRTIDFAKNVLKLSKK